VTGGLAVTGAVGIAADTGSAWRDYNSPGHHGFVGDVGALTLDTVTLGWGSSRYTGLAEGVFGVASSAGSLIYGDLAVRVDPYCQ
jgi:hypothetical protein